MHDAVYMEKSGLVTQVSDRDVKVLLLDTGGCASCSNNLCMLADAKSRYVNIPKNGCALNAGDEVWVRVTPRSAYVAAFWLYAMPFLLVMATLFGLTAWGIHESVAGISALLMLAPYYGGLFLIRKHMSGSCAIDLVKR